MDQISQTMAITDLDFTLRQADPRFDTDLKGDFTYLGLLQHAYSPELLGRFDGVAHLVLVPDRLTWAWQDDFGQAQISPFFLRADANESGERRLFDAPVRPDHALGIRRFPGT